MRKRIVLSALLATVMIACDKEDVNPNSSTASTTSIKTSTTNEKALGGEHLDYRTYKDNGLEGRCFYSNSSTCMRTVVVNSDNMYPSIVFQDVENGDDEAVMENFSLNYSYWEDVMPTDVIDGVIAGKITVSIKGKNSSNERFLIFKKVSNSEIICVVPFIV